MNNLISKRCFIVIGFLIGSVIVVGTGCAITGNDYSDISNVTVQQRIWQAGNSGNYSFTLQRGCFCMYGGPFNISVLDNKVAEVSPAWDDERGVPTEDYQFFWTIDELFDLIREAQLGEADKITVEYSTDGYPTSIEIDYIEKAIDDELFLKIENLQME